MSVITFSPIYMQRVWGGRELEHQLSRQLPDTTQPYGESWDMSDRLEAQSIVNYGDHKEKSLHDLWSQQRENIFGSGFEKIDRFPLLIKILDARGDLSIQVHPPEEFIDELGDEAKSEMWYIADTSEEASIYLGLKKDVTKASFQQAIKDGSVGDLVHEIQPQVGDAFFIPSGRIHAIGAGLLIYEIQQNSDTTYRVFDWNRNGLDGKPRELHIEESLKCIDFDDYTPSAVASTESTLTKGPFFHVKKITIKSGTTIGNPDPERFSIINVISGIITSDDDRSHPAGSLLLLARGAAPVTAAQDSIILQTTIPR